jgi:hypothetical protein
MPEKLNNELIDKRLVGRNIVRIGDYVNSKTKIKWKCLIDGYEWYTKPNTIFMGCGCPKCCNHAKLTNDIIDERLISENRMFVRLDDFINLSTKIRWKCLIDGYVWYAQPKCIFDGTKSGCRKCSGIEKLTNETIDDILLKDNRGIIRLDEYPGKNKIKIRWGCKSGHVWKAKTDGILNRRTGCPVCSGNMRLTNEDVDKKLICDCKDIIRLDNYINCNIKMNWKCKKCEHIWSTSFDSIVQGSGCPVCHMSRGESKIKLWLTKNNIDFIQYHTFEGCRFKKKLIFDFYLPKHNLCIEYDGRQHYEVDEYFGGIDGFNLTKKRDFIKNKYCENSNISLLRIPYWDDDKVDNILKENIL